MGFLFGKTCKLIAICLVVIVPIYLYIFRPAVRRMDLKFKISNLPNRLALRNCADYKRFINEVDALDRDYIHFRHMSGITEYVKLNNQVEYVQFDFDGYVIANCTDRIKQKRKEYEQLFNEYKKEKDKITYTVKTNEISKRKYNKIIKAEKKYLRHYEIKYNRPMLGINVSCGSNLKSKLYKVEDLNNLL